MVFDTSILLIDNTEKVYQNLFNSILFGYKFRRNYKLKYNFKYKLELELKRYLNKHERSGRADNMTENKRIDMITHYKKLLFFAFERFEGENIYQIRPYFAHIMMKDIEEYMPLSKKTVVDIGGARGEYCRILHEERNCHAVNLDPYPSWELKSEIHVHEPVWPQTVAGIAENIPFKDNKFDLVICRGVLEHILPEKQQDSVNELYRITKKGGFCYIVIPPWYSPYAGHRLRPFHIFPIKVARFLKNPFLSEKIYAQSYDQLNMYKVTFRNMSKMISSSNFNLVATKDTHLRLHFLTKIPLVRELAVPAVTFILKKV